jgi:hypothetical protein
MTAASRRGDGDDIARCWSRPYGPYGEWRRYAVKWWDPTMIRVIAVTASGFVLAACSMSMPSLDFFRGGPPTEVLRIESEPPGADARTAEGQSCRTPCELTVPATGEVAISFALQGYQPQTVNVRSEAAPTSSYAEAAPAARMQPNPVYAELTPAGPQRPQKRASPKKKVAAKRSVAPIAEPTGGTSPAPTMEPATAYPSNYPWPPPPPPN